MRIPAALTIGASAGVLALVVVVSWFAHPMADDFARAAVSGGEIIESLKILYTGWSGRWAGVGFSTVFISSLDPTRYYVALILGLNILCLAGLLFFLATFLEGLPRGYIIITALVLAAFYFTGMDSPGWTVFWWTGGVEYQLPIASALALIALMVRLPGSTSTTRRWAATGLCAFLAFLITGMHELWGLMLCVVLLTGAGVALRIGHRASSRWVVVCLVAVAGFLIVYLAPGNAVRGAVFVNGQDPIRTIQIAEALVRNRVFPWITDGRLLALTVILVLHPRFRSVRPGWLHWEGIPWKALVPAVALACLAIGFLGPSWAMGQSMPRRVMNANYAVFLIGWFASVFVWSRQAAERTDQRSVQTRLLVSLAFLILALGLVWNDNVRSAVRDLGRLGPWDAAMEARYELARRASSEGRRSLVLPVGPAKPEMQPSPEISPDPDEHQNGHFAMFFALDTVRLEADASSESAP